MAIDSRIATQVQTPQFAPTLSNLVQSQRQDEQRERQLSIQERQVANQERPSRPTEGQIERAYVKAGFQVDAAGRLLDSAANLGIQGEGYKPYRAAMQELLTAEQSLNQMGEDTTNLQRVIRLAQEDPEQAYQFIEQHITPMMGKILGDEPDKTNMTIGGVVGPNGIVGRMSDGQGNFFDMQGNPVELGPDDQFVRSSITAADAESLSPKQREDIVERQISTNQFIDRASDFVELVKQNQDLNTIVARAAGFADGFKQELGAIERAVLGSDFDEGLLDPGRYEFGGNLAALNPRAQGLLTSLAYAQARADEGPSARLTEQDIRRAMAQIGGNLSNPENLIGVMSDVVNRADRDYRTRHRILRDGEEFTGDLGLERFNSLIGGQEDNFGDAGGLPDGTEASNGEFDIVVRDGVWVRK